MFVSLPSLKVEYDKLANEKTEMQRHYVMVRTGVVELGVGFTAAPCLGPQVKSHRWCPPPTPTGFAEAVLAFVSTCLLSAHSVISLDQRVQGGVAETQAGVKCPTFDCRL